MTHRAEPPLHLSPLGWKIIDDCKAKRDIAKMLADTVDAIERHYAQFIPAVRDAVQHKMDHGFGIEERTKLARQRGQKVAVFPGSRVNGDFRVASFRLSVRALAHQISRERLSSASII